MITNYLSRFIHNSLQLSSRSINTSQYFIKNLLEYTNISNFSSIKNKKNVLSSNHNNQNKHNSSQTKQTKVSKQQIKIRQLNESKLKIHKLIDLNQPTQQLFQQIQNYSNLLIKHKQPMTGLKDYKQLVDTLKSHKVFSGTTTYLKALTNYRVYLSITGRFSQAIICAQDICHILKIKSANQLLLARELYLIGILLFQQRKISQSKKSFELNLKLNKQVYDQTYKQTIQTKDNLGIIQFWQGHYDKALEIFTKNSQISKRILIQPNSVKQEFYLKHYTFLQAIYDVQIIEEKDKQKIKQYQKRQIQEKLIRQDIIKININRYSVMALYYQTISLGFFNQSKKQLAIKYIMKSIDYIKKDIENKIQSIDKEKRFTYESNCTLAKNYKILAQYYESINDVQKSYKYYQNSINKFKKQLLSPENKQLLNLKNIDLFLQACKNISILTLLSNKQNKYQIAKKNLQNITQVCPIIFNYVYNLPQHYLFVQSQTYFLIGAIFIKQGKIKDSIKHFNQSYQSINNNKVNLCKKSITILKEQIRKITQDKCFSQLIQKNINQYKQLQKIVTNIKRLINQ